LTSRKGESENISFKSSGKERTIGRGEGATHNQGAKGVKKKGRGE